MSVGRFGAVVILRGLVSFQGRVQTLLKQSSSQDHVNTRYACCCKACTQILGCHVAPTLLLRALLLLE